MSVGVRVLLVTATLMLGCASRDDAPASDEVTDALGVALISGLPAGSSLLAEIPLGDRDAGGASKACVSTGSDADSIITWYRLDLTSLGSKKTAQLKKAIGAGKAYASLNVRTTLDTSGSGTSAWSSFKVGAGGYESSALSALANFSAEYADSAAAGVGNGSKTRSIALLLPSTVTTLDWSASTLFVEVFGNVGTNCKSINAGHAEADVDTVSRSFTGGYDAAVWIAP